MIRSNFKYPPAAASVMEKTTSYLATFADEEEEGNAVCRVEGGREGSDCRERSVRAWKKGSTGGEREGWRQAGKIKV